MQCMKYNVLVTIYNNLKLPYSITRRLERIVSKSGNKI